MANIERDLEAARQRLLDLSMRNRLLNYRPSRARTVQIVDELPEEIYRILVLDGRKMDFLPKKDEGETPAPEPSEPEGTAESEATAATKPRPRPMYPLKIGEKPPPGSDEIAETPAAEALEEALTDEERSALWRLPEPNGTVLEAHTDRFLQTPYDGPSLQKRLYTLNQQARTVIEEQGYSVLFLALGFLEWKEDPSAEKTRRAPLVLVPAELERTSRSSAFRIRWSEQEVVENISLRAKLSEQRIEIPVFEPPESKEALIAWFAHVTEAVRHMTAWRVVTDISLDLFSFTRFVMYKDLDPAAWPDGRRPADHPLIQEVLDPSGEDAAADVDAFPEGEIDDRLSCRDVYHVMDADPTQIAVIEEIKHGKNLVVEGPPGTGKSQTIANIIAELLAAGRSVLFVSQKMAALEVVKRRLDLVGLGDFCLELHSHKSRKKEVLKELERTLKQAPPKAINLEEDFTRLEALKRELNDYAGALREPIGAMGRSVYHWYEQRERARRHFARRGTEMPAVTIADAEACTPEGFAAARSALAALRDVLDRIESPVTHPWRHCEPGTVLPEDEREVRELLRACAARLVAMDEAFAALYEVSGLRPPVCSAEIPDAFHAAQAVVDSVPLAEEVIDHPAWLGEAHVPQGFVGRVKAYQSSRATVLERFVEAALDADASRLLSEFRERSPRLFRFLSARYRALKREIAVLCVGGKLRGSRARILQDLTALDAAVRERQAVRDIDADAKRMFGHLWQGETSDLAALEQTLAWLPAYRRGIKLKLLTAASRRYVLEGCDAVAVRTRLGETQEAFDAFRDAFTALSGRIRLDASGAFGEGVNETLFEDLAERMEMWERACGRLLEWSQFRIAQHACADTPAAPVAMLVEETPIEAADLAATVVGRFADAMLRRAFETRASLSGFMGGVHENRIDRFAALDREIIVKNRQRLAHKLHADQPRIYGGAARESEAGILVGQFSRKRGHLPIRKLMQACGGLIQKIKPCFMMSPLSVAYFLDPRSARFDVILFDEASQVRPEDALGALMRGNQVSVFGDSRQLPPTSFFDHLLESEPVEEDDAGTTVADVESILHQCRRSFVDRTLRWHYRSRHESLIAVSNQEFYENRLLIYPSAVDTSEALGLKFVHLPETVYDRGRSAANRAEARTVAHAALEHYREHPDKSLGIGTFNISQQQAILEEVELLLRRHPDMEDCFRASADEPFFVKNLETIQGDERAVIFLSVGYGYDRNGKLSRNFGPLNHEGGHRRLNVLITRAREKCVAFCNFRADQLQVEPGSPFGLRALKAFLKYAETGELAEVETSREDAESPFEESVCAALTARGYTVRRQVGCAGFRVDIGVVNPKAPGTYLVGIECDGAKYHSATVARDRDRLRQQVLENMGWRIHRIWSTDWYRNRKATERRLLETVAELEASAGTPDDEVTPREATFERIERVASGEGLFSNGSYLDAVPRYRTCRKVKLSSRPSQDAIYRKMELGEVPYTVLANAVRQVVSAEWPVHRDEVLKRIRVLWGAARAGKRIADTVEGAIRYAANRKWIRIEDAFLYKLGETEPPVRKRTDDPRPDMDLICDAEVAAAVRFVLEHQFATAEGEIPRQVSRAFGFRATSAQTAAAIAEVITRMLDRGDLERQPNGMIDLA